MYESNPIAPGHQVRPTPVPAHKTFRLRHVLHATLSYTHCWTSAPSRPTRPWTGLPGGLEPLRLARLHPDLAFHRAFHQATRKKRRCGAVGPSQKLVRGGRPVAPRRQRENQVVGFRRPSLPPGIDERRKRNKGACPGPYLISWHPSGASGELPGGKRNGVDETERGRSSSAAQPGQRRPSNSTANEHASGTVACSAKRSWTSRASMSDPCAWVIAPTSSRLTKRSPSPLALTSIE